VSTVEATDATPQLDRWNWGAAFFNWIWALGHGLWVYALLGFVLSFIPLAAFILFGIKGNEWAWARGGYSSVEELRAKERKWAIAALIVFVISILLVILVVVAAAGSSE
jgi:hypothetical protein